MSDRNAELGQNYRYAQWAGNPKGHAYNPKYCKAEVWSGGRGSLPSQCSKKPTRDGWCSTHHPERVAARDAAARAKYDSACAAIERQYAREDAADAVLTAACEWVHCPQDKESRHATKLADAVLTYEKLLEAGE